MEQQKSTPVDWVGKEFQGFVTQAVFSNENTQKVASWLTALTEVVTEGVYVMPPEGLHITLLDWVAPLFDYGGADKRLLFEELRSSYDAAFRRITRTIAPFEVQFDEVRVTPGTIILVGHDDGQFQLIREQFTQSVALPEGGKQPPNIIHSSLVRFVEPAIGLAPVEEYVARYPLKLTQRIDSFRLVETKREPMQDFDVLNVYPLGD